MPLNIVQLCSLPLMGAHARSILKDHEGTARISSPLMEKVRSSELVGALSLCFEISIPVSLAIYSHPIIRVKTQSQTLIPLTKSSIHPTSRTSTNNRSHTSSHHPPPAPGKSKPELPTRKPHLPRPFVADAAAKTQRQRSCMVPQPGLLHLLWRRQNLTSASPFHQFASRLL